MTSLDDYSVLLSYSAMSVYTLAFIVFALELARRRAPIESPCSLVLAGVTQSDTRRENSDYATADELEPAAVDSRPNKLLRVAVALLTLGWVLHLGATTLRGLAAERLPWSNMYEFSLTGTLIIVSVFLGLLIFIDLRYIGTFITGLVIVLFGIAAVRYYVPVVPLQPALVSYWLIIHVFVALAATAFFAIGFALSSTQLAQNRSNLRGVMRAGWVRRILDSLPDAETLETLAYRINIVGFILWTFTLIAGAIWADRAWGRYWGWDTKEVWTFIVWVIYAGYIHARATRGWRGNRSAWLGIIGFGAVLFNFGVVNVFFTGLHSYSGL